MERVPPERKRRGKEEAKKRQAREEGFTYYRPSRSIFSIRSVDYSRKFREEKRGGWRETEPNGNENENENVDERRDLRNAGGERRMDEEGTWKTASEGRCSHEKRAPWDVLSFVPCSSPSIPILGPYKRRFIRSRAMNHREAMLETLVEDTGTRLRKAQAGG